MEPAAATPLAAEVAFLRELLRSNRQQHRASKHFRLSAALVARAGRLAPVSVAIAAGDAAAAARAAAAQDAISLALAAARGVREDLARGFFAALNACWLACLGSFGRVGDPSTCHRVVFARFIDVPAARVVELLRRDAADLLAAAAPAATPARGVVDDDDDLGQAVGRAADVDYSDSGSEDAGAPVMVALVDRTPDPAPPAPSPPPPAAAEVREPKKRRKPTLPRHRRGADGAAKRRR
jgi:hypothetical protein